MLRTMKELQGYAIRATYGELGHVKDVYFDDRQWVVRYLIIETGSWLSSRKVLISPVRDRPTGLDREGTASLDHARTGEEQSRYRHGQAGLAAARDALPWALWLPLLLGRHRTLG